MNGGIWSKLSENNKDNADYAVGWDKVTQLNEKYNIDIQYVELQNDDGYSTSDAIQATITSGECFADLFTASDDVTVALRNYLVDISSFVDELQMGSIYIEPATWSGHTYGFTYDNMGSVYVLVYSRDYLKSIGMDVTPTEKFLAGEWSYDDCKEYFTELKAKLPDGTYPIGVHSNHWASMAPAANGAVSVDSDGGIHLADDNYVEAIEFYRELLDLGLAAPITNVAKNEDGSINADQPYGHADMCTATEAKTFVITMAEAWQMNGLESTLSGEWGIVPWPWGSNVTCEGDYTTLSPEYHTAQSIWTNMLAPQKEYRGAGAKDIPDEVLFMIAKDWCDLDNPSGAAARTAMYEAEKAGQPYENLGYTPGTQGDFSTAEDAALYDWLHSRVMVDWGHAVQELGYVRVNRSAAYIIAGGDDGRSTGESFKSEGEQAMADAFK
ncbi:MAG TPA: hypothetical protein DCZ91_08230 [Lachnospiraceae bacterium]|nr:hypothetical protein [Lachnospiraceae bacterium]